MLEEKEIKEFFDLLEKFKISSIPNVPPLEEIGREEVFFFLADNISYEFHQSGVESAQLERPSGRN